jgi:hypothetical protein
MHRRYLPLLAPALPVLSSLAPTTPALAAQSVDSLTLNPSTGVCQAVGNGADPLTALEQGGK